MKKSLKSPAILKFLNYCNLSLRGALSSWDEIGSSQILSSQILSSQILSSQILSSQILSSSNLLKHRRSIFLHLFIQIAGTGQQLLKMCPKVFGMIFFFYMRQFVTDDVVNQFIGQGHQID